MFQFSSTKKITSLPPPSTVQEDWPALQAPAVCRGWGWTLLRGGTPAPTRGQQMLSKSREKMKKEIEEKENTQHSNASVMRDLLGAGGNHPPSQSSSVAVDARTETDQGSLVEPNKVGTIFYFYYDNYISI